MSTSSTVRILTVLCLLPFVGEARAASAAEPAGKTLYRNHCASCHGEDGRGSGPVAGSLLKPPTDLTKITARGDRLAAEAELLAAIDGRRKIREHGPREMPVWGVVFDRELKGSPYAEYTTLLRARVLAEYVLSLQEPIPPK